MTDIAINVSILSLVLLVLLLLLLLLLLLKTESSSLLDEYFGHQFQTSSDLEPISNISSKEIFYPKYRVT